MTNNYYIKKLKPTSQILETVDRNAAKHTENAVWYWDDRIELDGMCNQACECDHDDCFLKTGDPETKKDYLIRKLFCIHECKESNMLKFFAKYGVKGCSEIDIDPHDIESHQLLKQEIKQKKIAAYWLDDDSIVKGD